MGKRYGYLNDIERNPFERKLEREGFVDNTHLLTRQEKMSLKPYGPTSLDGREKRPRNRREEGVGLCARLGSCERVPCNRLGVL